MLMIVCRLSKPQHEQLHYSKQNDGTQWADDDMSWFSCAVQQAVGFVSALIWGPISPEPPHP